MVLLLQEYNLATDLAEPPIVRRADFFLVSLPTWAAVLFRNTFHGSLVRTTPSEKACNGADHNILVMRFFSSVHLW